MESSRSRAEVRTNVRLFSPTIIGMSLGQNNYLKLSTQMFDLSSIMFQAADVRLAYICLNRQALARLDSSLGVSLYAKSEVNKRF